MMQDKLNEILEKYDGMLKAGLINGDDYKILAERVRKEYEAKVAVNNKALTSESYESTIERKNGRKWIVAIVAIVVIVGGVFFGSKAYYSRQVQKAADSVLFLEVYDAFGELVGTGSGYVIDNGTKIVTNYHVASAGCDMIAYNKDGNELTHLSNVFAYDSSKDLAIVICDERINITPLTVVSSAKSKQGDHIYTIGYPKGFSNTMSDGLISSRLIDEGVELLQLSAAISPGSSGGPVLNDKGQVVGTVCATYNSDDAQNINFAIASDELLALLNTESDNKPLVYVYFSDPYNNAVFLYSETDICYVDDEVIIIAFTSTPNAEVELLGSGFDVIESYIEVDYTGFIIKPTESGSLSIVATYHPGNINEIEAVNSETIEFDVLEHTKHKYPILSINDLQGTWVLTPNTDCGIKSGTLTISGNNATMKMISSDGSESVNMTNVYASVENISNGWPRLIFNHDGNNNVLSRMYITSFNKSSFVDYVWGTWKKQESKTASYDLIVNTINSNTVHVSDIDLAETDTIYIKALSFNDNSYTNFFRIELYLDGAFKFGGTMQQTGFATGASYKASDFSKGTLTVKLYSIKSPDDNNKQLIIEKTVQLR